MLTTALTTDANGAFTVPAGYACPAAASQLYVVVRGGQVGSSASNSAITLATPVGACNQVVASSQFVLNEVTTAATAWGLSQFLSSGGNIGASATNTQGLVNAVATVANLANPTTGTSPGASFPQERQLACREGQFLANLLNTCTTATSSAACSPLFSATTPAGGTAPTNTLDAVAESGAQSWNERRHAVHAVDCEHGFYACADHGALGLDDVYQLHAAGHESPTGRRRRLHRQRLGCRATSAPHRSFRLPALPVFPNGITGGGLFQSYGLAVDAQNNVWIPNEDSTAAGVNGGLGSVTILSSTGQVTSGAAGYYAGGISYPIAIAVDTNATTWVI